MNLNIFDEFLLGIYVCLFVYIMRSFQNAYPRALTRYFISCVNVLPLPETPAEAGLPVTLDF